jgi:glycerol kinase
MEQFILALDQGTTSSRAILFDRQGQVRGCAQREFPQHFPHLGWVEHDPMDIWESQLAVARQVLGEQQVDASRLAAVGIANQRETTILWERASGRPLAPAIVWQDRRTAGMCDRLRAQGEAERIRQRTGLELDAYFSATKLAWLLDELPGARARAERGELAFGTVDSWLVYQLCGRHVTDPGNASRTMLFNLATLGWDDELLALFRIPAAVLPEVLPSSALIGRLDPQWLGAAVPLAGIAGDQQAATFGQACLRPGMVKNTYGTGCFMLMHAGTLPPVSAHRLLATVGWQLGQGDAAAAPGGQGHVSRAGTAAEVLAAPPSTAAGTQDRHAHPLTYLLEGSVFMAGATVQWLRDGLGIIERSSDVEALAASVPDSGGVYLVPAFAGLGAPHWDPYARGALLGMTRGTTRAHIARAALDAIAYQSAELLSAMQADAGCTLAEVRADGGASRNDLLMQFQADLLGVPVVRPRVTETTALGAAGLAGLAVGFWETQEAFAANWQAERRFVPGMGADQRAEHMARWQRAVTRAGQWSV